MTSENLAPPALAGAPQDGLHRTPLTGEQYHRDPYPLFARMVAEGSVHPVQFPAVHAWLITGYAAARSACTDARLGKSHDRASPYFHAHASIMPEPQHSELQVHLLHVDGDRHTRMRSLVAGPLSARRTESLRAAVRSDVDDLLDRFPDPDGGVADVDLVRQFTALLPLRALARAIGLPDHLRERFDPVWGTVVAPVGPDHPDRPLYQGRLRALQDYIADIVEELTHVDTETGSDVSVLQSIVGAAQRDRITPAERDSMIFQLLVAGQDPVSAQLQLCLLDLAERPDLCDRLRRDPAAIDAAVEELLRHDSAFNLTTWRFLSSDDEISGCPVPGGDSVIIALGAANRDPAQFPDPDTVDIDRPAQPHLAFGAGPHACPGAALARIQLQEALTAILTRFPDLEITADRQALAWSPAPLTRAVASLPARYRTKGPRR